MKHKDELFTEYLREIHAGQADGVLDDDLSDDYDRWLAGLTQDDIIEMANDAMSKIL